MKYCPNCGKELADEAVVCVNCGAAQAAAPMAVNDAPSTGFAVLSFFFPLVGLILYLCWKDKTPLKAKSCGKGALIGFIVSVALSIISGILTTIAGAALLSSFAY